MTSWFLLRGFWPKFLITVRKEEYLNQQLGLSSPLCCQGAGPLKQNDGADDTNEDE